MGITVNGVDIDDAAIEQELMHHSQAKNPVKQAVHEVILRTVLLQEADKLGITGDTDDVRIENLFAQEVRVPLADDTACMTFYNNQPRLFTTGELVEARHILFQVTPTVPLELLRGTAEAVLDELRQRPERFAELAKEYSNCASSEVGGSLGQLTRGQTVPEFEDFVFRLSEMQLADRLLETRFGLHIIQVMRKIDGKLLPFDAVKSQIADRLTRQSWQRAVHQYLQILVGKADIQGITLEGAQTPLVQ